MANIGSAPKSKMTNSELLNFCLLITNYINSSNFAVLKFKAEATNFEQKQIQFDGSINKISKQVYWLKVKDLKARINNSRIGFYNLVKGETTSEDPLIASAAKVLYAILKNYTKMGHMKYNDVLRFLDSLIKECEQEDNKTRIEKLELTKRVTALRTLYNEALELEKKLFDDEGLNKRKRKPVITRAELCDAYDKLVKRLNALAIVEGDTDYLELFAWWNALIDRYRNSISYRLGARKGGSTDDGESSQHDPSTGGQTGGGGDDDRPVIE